MNIEYKEIYKSKENFLGLKEGFKFLDLSLNLLTQLKNKNKENNLIIYDYRNDSKFEINVNFLELYKFLQNLYIDFLIKEKFQKYKWYDSFCNNIYVLFAENRFKPDAISDLFIKIFTKAFIYLSNSNNKILVSSLKSFVMIDLVSLTSDDVQSSKYFDRILLFLIQNNTIIISGDYFSINDRFIYYDFIVSSLNLPYFFSKDSFDLKYSCSHGIKNLLNVIEFYLLDLFNEASFSKVQELFSYNLEHKEYFSFLMNYEDSNISKIGTLETPFDELFIYFFFKKLILNEYCFNSIIISCFDFYVFNPKIKNILMDKSDFRFNFNSYERVIKNII